LTPKIITNIKKVLEVPADTLILLMLAVYEPRKGHEFIFKVMDKVILKLPQTHLLICGYGSNDEVQLVEDMRLKSSSSSHIHLQGNRSDVQNLLAQTDIQVVPSQSYESFGYTSVEAMSCEVPVIATNVGGLVEVVEDGVCGYVVDYQNVDRFAQRIVELLRNEDLRGQMGKQGRQRFERHFTAERMARHYADLMHSEIS